MQKNRGGVGIHPPQAVTSVKYLRLERVNTFYCIVFLQKTYILFFQCNEDQMRIPAGTSPWVQASANRTVPPPGGNLHHSRARISTTSGREPPPPLGGNIQHLGRGPPPSPGGNLRPFRAGTSTSSGLEPPPTPGVNLRRLGQGPLPPVPHSV